MIYDITSTISEKTIVWPGDPRVSIERITDTHKGDSAAVSKIVFGSHTGTHVDAPRHYLDDGIGVDRLDLDTLIGDALVLDVTKQQITADLLGNEISDTSVNRILFKTSSSLKFPAYLTNDGAQWLLDHSVSLIGIDTQSVADTQNPDSVHLILLKANIVIIEGLCLQNIRPGTYQLICLPLKLQDCDGVPARVVIIDK